MELKELLLLLLQLGLKYNTFCACDFRVVLFSSDRFQI
jgi:hypothetical protein